MEKRSPTCRCLPWAVLGFAGAGEPGCMAGGGLWHGDATQAGGVEMMGLCSH